MAVGLIFTPPMMTGILNGSKNQTCRFPSPQIKSLSGTGDEIWVRENFYHKWVINAGGQWEQTREVLYTVDLTSSYLKHGEREVWRSRPSIHMPRWASRITLVVDSISKTTVQSLTLEQINREGIGEFTEHRHASQAWKDLWESLYGPESWVEDKELMVIGFKKVFLGAINR